MTVAELFYGAEKSNYKPKNLGLVEEFILSIDVINTDFDILRKFGELKAKLSDQHLLLPDADILTAATALTKCTKLITGNVKHFSRFDALVIENWAR